MKPMHLFSPLRKQSGFPTTSVNLKIADVKYDLVLPAEISDQLLVHFIGSEDSYRRVDRYCNSEGMDAIRARPFLLSDEYRGLPTFAVSFYGVEDGDDDDKMNGWVALRLLASGLAARQLYHRAHRREFITQELADYIIRHDAYFEQCGGFELLRIRYYFDAEDRYTVMLDLDRDEPPGALLKERGRMKTRLRDMMSAEMNMRPQVGS
jgi:hypothetical protein